ncbi:protein-disulfide reductase DsbD family protein [Gemmatimonas sp.]|uniref:protein-disulfide reductase DsbD family protein n=1 Tax=Gemmatimonas sp. TaxID=1962908 RepID=UPI003982ED03
MLRRSLVLGVLSLVALSRPASLRSQSVQKQDLTPNSELSLLAESTGLRPGATTTVALRITMEKGWHTYWTNPGDAGLPLAAQWTLPAGVTVSALRFPAPHVLPQPPLMSYGYEGELYVLADVSVSAAVPVGTALTVAADVDFLVCADVCLPASGHVEWKAQSLAQPVPSTFASAIANTRARLVQDGRGWTTSAWRDGARIVVWAYAPGSATGPTASVSGGAISTIASAKRGLPKPYLIPDSTGVLAHEAVQRVAWIGDTVVLSLTADKHLSDSVTAFTGVLLNDVNAPTSGVQLTLPLQRKPPAIASRLLALVDASGAITSGGAIMAASTRARTSAATQTDVAAGADMGVALALLLAFVGGLVLNLMPCVFPVLSIKILAFVERGGDNDGGAIGRRHAMVFTAGVLTTFWALAGVLLALRAGGAQLGWGFQLQSPAVVTVMALVVFALALNLSGVFTMGMSLTRLGAVGAGERYSDSFLTGLLAVVVATPCTAPFMGAALGYALTQHAAIGMAVFTSLGLGLAAPYILFASSPALLRKLPRPGPWLETLKQLLAFPLYATVVWLLWVLGRQAGSDQVALALLFAVGVSLTGWMAGRAQYAGRARGSLMGLVLLVGTIAAGGVAIASQPSTPVGAAAAPAGWETWSAARVASARDSGRVVFVDFTAAWCLSCQINERVALHTDAVERAFVDANAVLLRADWTSRDAEITAVLASLGRSGVPLYVVYPSGNTRAPEILPAVLTPGMVIDAVTRAASGATVAVAASPR